MSQSIDCSGLADALEFVERTTGRSMAESLNRAGLHAIIGSGSRPGAMQLTPKAQSSSISAVTDAQIAAFIAARARRINGSVKAAYPNAAAFKDGIRKERARRMRARGYTAYAGWSKAAKEMGGTGARGVTADFAESDAAAGYGSKATATFLEAVIANTTPMGEAIGFDALQEGVDNAAADLVDYGNRKLEEAFRAVT